MTDLAAAYALNGPDACARLYADWAASYDVGFAQATDYRLPAHVAAVFLAHGGSGPVLDVGAGTGLLAQQLRDMGLTDPVDAVDLSPEMLATAATKGLYRQLHAANITAPLGLSGPYHGIVSSGTFTHGHVGPEGIAMLEATAAPGALFALSINQAVYASNGFDVALARRLNVTLIPVPIYGPGTTDPAHVTDTALIALWRHPTAP